MAQLIVRNLEPEMKERLRRRAAVHGRSMEQEVRDILQAALAREEDTPAEGLGTRISRRFAGLGLTEDLPELRGQLMRPVDFDE